MQLWGDDMKKTVGIGLIVLSGGIGYFIGLRVGDPIVVSVGDSGGVQGAEAKVFNEIESRDLGVSVSPDAAAKSLDVSRIERLLVDVGSLDAGPLRERELEALFRQWGAVDGKSAYERAIRLRGRERLACMEAAATGWAKLDPRGAWAEMMRVTSNGSAEFPNLKPIISEVARNDLALAVELIQGIDNPDVLQDDFQVLVDIAAEESSYLKLLKMVTDLDSVDTSGILTEKIFETWGKYEADAPLVALDGIADSEVVSKAMLGFMSGWAQVDGEAAFLYALENRSDPNMADLLSPVAEQWATYSTSDELRSLVDQVVAIDDGGAVFGDVSSLVAQRMPILVMENLSSVENDRARSMTSAVAMREWAVSDFQGAEEYYRSMPYDWSKQQAFWGVFNVGMQHGQDVGTIVELAFGLGDSAAVDKTLKHMAEYTRVSPLESSSRDLSAALYRALDRRSDISAETRVEVLKWLDSEK